MEKIILFGASTLGKRVYDKLKNKHRVIYFTDNDKEKWKKKLCGIKIIPPKKLLELENVKIVITSMYYIEIAEQLIDLGLNNFEFYFKLADIVLEDPYTMSEDRNECIFIHIPKTAGVSISNALFGKEVGHRRIRKFKLFDVNKFKNYFKFAFVRNPWSRFLSAYTFLKHGGKNTKDNEWARRNLSKYNNFKEFILSLKDKKTRKKVLQWIHFIPQYEFICDNNLNIKVDYIGYFENLTKDFNYIKEKLNLNSELKHFNKSSHGNYKNYYNSETKRIIKNLYKKDIELFDYSF